MTCFKNIALIAAIVSFLSGNAAFSQSFFKNTPINSSASAAEPRYAVDGDLNTAWNSGGYAPAWINLTVYSGWRIEGIKLTPAQTPSGRTKHRIMFYMDGHWQEVAVIDEVTSDRKAIEIKFQTPKTNVTNIKVETLISPSWVAWYEIEPILNTEDIITEQNKRDAEKERIASAEKAEAQRQEMERKRAEAARVAALKKLVAGGAQSLYLQAGKAQRSGRVDVSGVSFYASELYELLIEKFPSSDYAVKATDQLNAMDRSERQASATRDAAAASERAANAQRDADRNSSGRAACFSQVRSCEARCSESSNRGVCIQMCQRTCN